MIPSDADPDGGTARSFKFFSIYQVIWGGHVDRIKVVFSRLKIITLDLCYHHPRLLGSWVLDNGGDDEDSLCPD